MNKVIAFAASHKALIGSILIAAGGYLTGHTDIGAALAAIVAAFSKGLQPAPQS